MEAQSLRLFFLDQNSAYIDVTRRVIRSIAILTSEILHVKSPVAVLQIAKDVDR